MAGPSRYRRLNLGPFSGGIVEGKELRGMAVFLWAGDKSAVSKLSAPSKSVVCI